MEKYNKMLEHNREVNEKKKNRALDAIHALEEHEVRVQVCTLQDMTGLSRGFFYKNQEVRAELLSAWSRQQGKDLKCYKSYSKETKQEQNEEIGKLENRIHELELENRKLKNNLDDKVLQLIKSL